MTTTDDTIPYARFIGTTDSITTCECCGRSNLKHTVALIIGDADTEVYYGVTCAAHALKRTVKEIRQGAKAADDARAAAERAVRDAESRAASERWKGWLTQKTAGMFPMGTYEQRERAADTFRQIEILGGYGAARAAYLAEGNQPLAVCKSSQCDSDDPLCWNDVPCVRDPIPSCTP